MKVQQTPTNPVQSSETSGAGQARKSGKAERRSEAQRGGEASARTGESSHAEISSRARDMATAKAAATETPDVRDDRIADIKRRIAAGKYQIDAEGIADKMVDDHLQTSGMS